MFMLIVVSCRLMASAQAAPPVIVAQPGFQFSWVGSNVTFSVAATGSTPLYYQWFFNGSALALATNDTLPLNNLATNNAGNYSVTISNSAGSVTSDSAGLLVLTFSISQPDSYRTSQDTPLLILAANLLTNDTLASAILPPDFPFQVQLSASVTGVSPVSAQGGTVSLAKDQLWVAHHGGQFYNYSTALAADGAGNVYVTGIVSTEYTQDSSTIKYSSNGTPIWTNRYKGPGDFYISTALALDGLGNVYVTGYSQGVNPYRPSNPKHDYATLKYANDGTPIWTNRYNGPAQQAHDNAMALAVDNLGNVYVTGYSAGTGVSNNYDYATIKYSSDGNELWVSRYEGLGGTDDYAHSLVVGGSGSVYVNGISGGHLTTLKYAGDGTPIWTNRYERPTSQGDSNARLALDGADNLYVACSSAGLGTGYDYVTLKYSSDGTALWTNRYNSPDSADDINRALIVDHAGSVYVTGYSFGSAGLLASATVKYASDGTPLWNNFFGAMDSSEALAVDKQGDLYVGGSRPGPGGGKDYVVVKFASNGVSLWEDDYNGPGDLHDSLSAIAVDDTGNVYVTGTSQSPGESDYATVKFSPNAQITYTPPMGFEGTDTFTYTIAELFGIVPPAIGVVTVNVVSPFRFNIFPSSFRFTTNGLWLQLDGTDAEHTVVVYSSENLMTWRPMLTNLPMTGTLQFLDSSATNTSQRFYRAVLQ